MLYLLRIIKNEIVSDLSSPGSFFVYAIVVAMFFVSGNYNFAMQLFIAAFAVSASIYIIKLFYYKPRPDNPRKIKHIDIFIKLNESAFPSVHSARATLLGMAFISRYQTPIAIFFAALIILSVAVSRIMMKRHYISDVVAGILLGAFTGYLVFLA